MKHTFFLAPAGTGVGLTTVALGLVNALDRRGVRVAFFKPIAQASEGDSGPERSTLFIRADDYPETGGSHPAGHCDQNDFGTRDGSTDGQRDCRLR